MEKTEIKVSCIDQVLKITESPILASGGLSEVRVVFSFCEKWNGFEKTAIFYRDDEPVYYSILDENDTCIVPWEVCYEEGTFKFGVFGDKGVTRRTSLEVKYKVKKGAITADTMPSDPTPAVYDQIMSLLGEMRESQAGFISVAEKAVVDANTATQEAQTATANANTATASANKATQDANSAASNANAEAGKATKATEDANTAIANANKATSDARTATTETNTARENIVREAGEILASLSDAVYAAPIECTANGDVIALSDASNQQLAGLTLYCKTIQNGTPTPSAPVALESVGESIGVTVCGKNLLDLKGATLTYCVLTDADKGSVKMNLSNANYATIKITDLNDYLMSNQGKVFTLRVDNNPSDCTLNVVILGTRTDGLGYQEINSSAGALSVSITPSGFTEITALQLRVGRKTTAYTDTTTVFSGISFAIGTDISFEPYKGQTLTATAEGGLHGIGEVKDEIDFARGVRVRSVEKVQFDGTEPWYTGSMANAFYIASIDCAKLKNFLNTSQKRSSHFKDERYLGEGQSNGAFCSYGSAKGQTMRFKYNAFTSLEDWKAWVAQQYANGTPLEVAFQLVNPVETPLTAEELAAFAALHSNKPNTTAFNDAGAEMKLSYVADTKLYIDQKIAAISAALLNT